MPENANRRGPEVSSHPGIRRSEVTLLRESEARYRALAEGSPLAIFVNRDDKVVLANPACVQLFGASSPEELIGRSALELFDPDSRSLVSERIHVGSETVPLAEVRIARLDGTPVDVEATASPLLGQGFKAIQVVLRDITERKNAEQLLRESEARYRALAESMLEGFAYCRMVYDDVGHPVDWEYLEVNSAFTTITGLDNVVGKRVLEVLPTVKEDTPELFEAYGRVATTGEPEEFEIDFGPLDMWLKVTALCPEPGHFVAIFENITERKRAEEAMRESEDKFRYVFHHSGVAKCITRPSGEIEVNDAFLAMLGYSREELDEHGTWQQLTHPDDVARSEKVVASLIAGERTSARFEKRYLRKDGSVVWTDVTTALRRHSDGSPDYFMTAIIDITERKHAEQELLARTEDLARSNAELEKFAYVASHDLQEPLRMVASYVQLLQRRYQGKLDSDADEFIGYAVDGATRMQTLINDLLAYSRIGTQGTPFLSTDLETVLGDVLHVLVETIADAGATVTHDPMPVVSCDPSQIGRVFQNLIGNAVKFHGDEPPKVHVSAREADGEWVFSVADNGIGVEPQYFDRVFVIFQRLQPRADYAGTGMGLAICKRIIQRHGGRIWVESEPEVGSTFYFALRDDKEA